MGILPNNKYQLIGFIFFVLLQLMAEYFLGKTQKVEPNSILDLVFMVVKRLISKLFKGEAK